MIYILSGILFCVAVALLVLFLTGKLSTPNSNLESIRGTAKEFSEEKPKDNSWLIGEWQVVHPEFGVYKLIIRDNKNFYAIEGLSREDGTYTVNGDEITLYYNRDGGVGTNAPLNKINQTISFGDGYYYRKTGNNADRNNTANRIASITGTNVIIRESHSTTSAKLGNFDTNETVKILDEYYPSNNNEAIVATPIHLLNSSGKVVYTLPKGKAVKIISRNSGKVQVSFYHSEYGTLTANINNYDLESIAGEKWYKVKRNNGQTGWVFSKFVNIVQ
jgi:hypothetical protein